MQADLQVLLACGQALQSPWPQALGGDGQRVRERLITRLLRIRDKDGVLVPLLPNRAQREYQRRCTRRNVVLKARQLGVTTYVAARFFVATITRPGTLSVQVAHDQRSAEEIFRIVHRFLENLPETVRAGALQTSRANVRQVVFPELDSEYRIETAADPHAGRGLTIHNLHCSEVAQWPHDAVATLASLRAAVPPQGEIVLESTPNGAAGCFYDEWQRAQENGYTRHFFPWWYEPAYTIEDLDVSSRGGRKSDEGSTLHLLEPLAEEERELAAKHGLTPGQLLFRRHLRAQFRRLAPQEFAEDDVTCFLASGDCVFDVEQLQARLASCGTAAEQRDSGRLLIFLPPTPGGEYILGVDPAGGGADGDFACIQVIERATGMQCAELRGHFPPAELARRTAELGREYNRALVAVERNNHGHAVLALLAQVEKYDRLYQSGGRLGWLTSPVSRPPMIENFAAMLALAPHLFTSPRLLEECRTFIRQADGCAAAASGAHDDCVLAMAIAQAVRQDTAGARFRSGTLALESLPVR